MLARSRIEVLRAQKRAALAVQIAGLQLTLKGEVLETAFHT
jgi:hypothetical protein